MANQCKICKRFISTSEGVKCTKCAALFHTACLKLSPGHQVSNKWKCGPCKGKNDNNAQSKTPSNQSAIQSQEQDEGKNISFSGDTSPSGIAEEVRRVIRAEMSCFKGDISRICATIADFNRRIDDVEARLTSLEERFSADREQCRPEMTEDVAEIITNLQNKLNDREQEYFLNDIEVSGIQETSGENLLHLASLIGRKLGVELGERDLVSAERSGSRVGTTEGESHLRPRVITIRLGRRVLRDQLLRAARVRRDVDTSGIIDGTPRRFYVNERLTRNNRQLFYKARQEGRRKCWRFVWTNSGRIFIRRDANAVAHRIRSEADIQRFFSVASV